MTDGDSFKMINKQDEYTNKIILFFWFTLLFLAVGIHFWGTISYLIIHDIRNEEGIFNLGSDALRTKEAGENLLTGRGFVWDTSAHGCEPPCDARGVSHIWALCLAVGPPNIYILWTISIAVLTLALFHFYGGWWGMILFGTNILFTVQALNTSHEGLDLLVFFITFIYFKNKEFGKSAILSAILLHVRYPIGSSFIICGLILSKEYRKYILLFIAAYLLYFYINMADGTHPAISSTFKEQHIVGEGVFGKIYSVLSVGLKYLILGPMYELKMLYLPFLIAVLRKPDKFYLLFFALMILHHSPLWFHARYLHVPALFGILFISWVGVNPKRYHKFTEKPWFLP